MYLDRGNIRKICFIFKEVYHLPKGSIITFDKGYVDYTQYEEFTKNTIWYVTRLMDDAIYKIFHFLQFIKAKL
jgi:hypothetical protein